MSIPVTCESCEKTVKVKDELAGKRVRCPGCRQPLQIPEAAPVDDWNLEEYDDVPMDAPPSGSRPGKKTAAQGRPQGFAAKVRAWWHWGLVGVCVVTALLSPTAGLILAGVVAFGGMMLALVAGGIPILMVVVKDPGTVLTMLVSRRARFDMMRQPDDHPYKQLVRNTGLGFRPWFWKGLLLMGTIVPATLAAMVSPVHLLRGIGGAPGPEPRNFPGAAESANARSSNPVMENYRERMEQRRKSGGTRPSEHRTAPQRKKESDGSVARLHIKTFRRQYSPDQIAFVHVSTPLKEPVLERCIQRLGKAGGAEHFSTGRVKGGGHLVHCAPIADLESWIAKLDLGEISEINTERRRFTLEPDMAKLEAGGAGE